MTGLGMIISFLLVYHDDDMRFFADVSNHCAVKTTTGTDPEIRIDACATLDPFTAAWLTLHESAIQRDWLVLDGL